MIEKSLVKWLTDKTYECFYNFPLGGKFPDMIAIKNNKLVAFELKKHVSEIPQAMGQCLFYLNKANEVYIVLPIEEEHLLSDSIIKTLKLQGIGLIVANDKIKTLIEAKNFNKDNMLIIEKIKEMKNVNERDIKERADTKKLIIEILKEHPEGLILMDVAKYISVNRFTAAKYVYGLIGEGLVYQRKVGTSKLCYLKVKK